MRRILALALVIVIGGVAWFLQTRILHTDPLNPTKTVYLEQKSANGTSYQRRYRYFRPGRLQEMPAILLILHGSDTSAFTMQIITGSRFDALARDRGSFIPVYPEGYGKYWNDCRKSSSYPSRLAGLDDEAFLQMVVDSVAGLESADRNKVYATGFSNGGQMLYRLIRKGNNLKLAGGAAIAASLPVAENDGCGPLDPGESFLVIQGESDPIVPWAGGRVIMADGIDRGSVYSGMDNLRKIARAAGCTGSITRTRDLASRTELFSARCDSAQVSLLLLIGTGHVIPNRGFGLWPGYLGPSGHASGGTPDIPEIIVRFFGL